MILKTIDQLLLCNLSPTHYCVIELTSSPRDAFDIDTAHLADFSADNFELIAHRGTSDDYAQIMALADPGHEWWAMA